MENNLKSILDEIKTLVNIQRDAVVHPDYILNENYIAYIEKATPEYISEILMINSEKIIDDSEKYKYLKNALINMFWAGIKCSSK